MPTLRHAWTVSCAVGILVLAAAGVLLLGDRPGLEASYFALGKPWEGRPLYSTVEAPELQDGSAGHQPLLIDALFSVRWAGWWNVKDAGRHRFVLDADDGGFVRVDGETLIDSREDPDRRSWKGSTVLEPGLHEVEIGLVQTDGESRLALQWNPPGKARDLEPSLPIEELYSGRPVAPRRALRQALADWPLAWRRLLGAILLLAAVLLATPLAGRLAAPAGRLRSRLAVLDGSRLRAALLLGLVALAFFAVLPFTGTVRGGDDTAYLHAATFGEKSWFFNRYAHVYLLKLFVTLSGGDPFVGVRLWWSFVFAVTVASLAVAVSSVGPGLQLRTLAVTLFLLLAQTTLLGMIGAGFADYSAMMFVTAAVAVYLHGLGRPRGDPRARYEWHALAIGALTLAAFRSKEVGAVLLLLPLLFLIRDGRIDLRAFARRIAWWALGVAGALAVLVVLDGLILGDVVFTFEGSRFARSGHMNFPEQVRPRSESANWLQLLWAPGGHAAGLSIRYLWMGVAAGAAAAGLARRRLEIRLLHLLPIAYLLALIALYVRLPHPVSNRMLIPIIPVATLMTGLLLHYAGLDDIPWKRLLDPRVLLPAGLATAVLALFVVPYRMGTLAAADVLPVATLRRYGWDPDIFAVGMLLPALVLTALVLLALAIDSRRARVVALLVGCVAVFGLGFEFNRTTLARKEAAQKGALLLYPWRVFADELTADPPQTVALSPDLQWRYGMSAATLSSIAQLALDRRDVQADLSRELPLDADVAIASRYVARGWMREMPALAATARTDPSGFLVLVRPRANGAGH